jgi:hypothetical protein
MYYLKMIFHKISPTHLLDPSPTPYFKSSQVFLIYFLKYPNFSTIKSNAPNVTLYCFFLKFKSNLLVKRLFSLLNATFAVAILDLVDLC